VNARVGGRGGFTPPTRQQRPRIEGRLQWPAEREAEGSRHTSLKLSCHAEEPILPGVDLALCVRNHHMTSRKRKSRSATNPSTSALARWETEGGALGSVQRGGGEQRVPLSEQETRILQYLGAAVLLRWNDLPTHIQRELFEHALVDIEPRKVTMQKEQIARFLHTHKDDKKGRRRRLSILRRVR